MVCVCVGGVLLLFATRSWLKTAKPNLSENLQGGFLGEFLKTQGMKKRRMCLISSLDGEGSCVCGEIGGSSKWDRDNQRRFPMHSKTVYLKTTHSVLCLAHEAMRQAHSHLTGTFGELSKQIIAFSSQTSHNIHTITPTKER